MFGSLTHAEVLGLGLTELRTVEVFGFRVGGDLMFLQGLGLMGTIGVGVLGWLRQFHFIFQG